MTTQARKDFDDELAAWLEDVRLSQRDDVSELDAYADLYVKNHEAAAIKDKKSPAAKAKHAEINDALTRMGL